MNDKTFMWVFDWKDFEVETVEEIFEYEINIDEETNASSTISIFEEKELSIKAKDIVAVKKNNIVIYWGIIESIDNDGGGNTYRITLKYITNLFDTTIELKNEALIKTTGIEDQIADAINTNFINNIDTFVNLNYLEVAVNSHTIKQTTVSNVNNNIYNLHTWITNVTQNYGIIYTFEIVNKKLRMNIEKKSTDKRLIDIKAMNIVDYTEVFETDITAKVTVLTDTNPYYLFLLNDRTTTTNMSDVNRADGKAVTIYTGDFDNAAEAALNEIQSNRYNHNITFSLYDEFIEVGTPIAIKTKKSIIYDTYISAVKIDGSKYFSYTCGNIRTKFIDKLLKERKQ